MNAPLRSPELDQLFLQARTHNAWQPTPVSNATVRPLYDLLKWAPTAANSNPARLVFIRSVAAKARLMPSLSLGNVEKVAAAPCCAIVAYDSQFHDLLPKLFPSRDMRSGFVGKPELIAETAKRNSALQGAYLIVAARALGLDAGPMSGFDRAALGAEFFPDGRWTSNFLATSAMARRRSCFPVIRVWNSTRPASISD
jgi:3-hydroxypropanoate dehydrogenase